MRAEEAKKAERLDGCSFKQTAYYDGDSFSLLTATGDEKICRLYAVNTCETDNEFTERVAEQALYFGITSEQAVELGNKAKNFTEELLKNKKLSFVTKWHKALGRSKSDRFYGEIIVDGESLACILVKNGLARIHGIIPPNDGAFVFTRAKLEQLEAEAKKAGAGGWGIAKGKKAYEKEVESAPAPIVENEAEKQARMNEESKQMELELVRAERKGAGAVYELWKDRTTQQAERANKSKSSSDVLLFEKMVSSTLDALSRFIDKRGFTYRLPSDNPNSVGQEVPKSYMMDEEATRLELLLDYSLRAK